MIKCVKFSPVGSLAVPGSCFFQALARVSSDKSKFSIVSRGDSRGRLSALMRRRAKGPVVVGIS